MIKLLVMILIMFFVAACILLGSIGMTLDYVIGERGRIRTYCFINGLKQSTSTDVSPSKITNAAEAMYSRKGMKASRLGTLFDKLSSDVTVSLFYSLDMLQLHMFVIRPR